MKAFIMKFFLPAMALLLMAGLPAMAADTGPIQLENAFTRAAPAGGVGGFFVTIINAGAADRLIGIASPVAGKAELHETMSDNGVMKMRGVASLPVPANGKVALQPGGYHVMLIGLTQPLVVGQSVPVTLTFEKAGAITVQASVAKAGASAPMRHN